MNNSISSISPTTNSNYFNITSSNNEDAIHHKGSHGQLTLEQLLALQQTSANLLNNNTAPTDNSVSATNTISASTTIPTNKYSSVADYMAAINPDLNQTITENLQKVENVSFSGNSSDVRNAATEANNNIWNEYNSNYNSANIADPRSGNTDVEGQFQASFANNSSSINSSWENSYFTATPTPTPTPASFATYMPGGLFGTNADVPDSNEIVTAMMVFIAMSDVEGMVLQNNANTITANQSQVKELTSMLNGLQALQGALPIKVTLADGTSYSITDLYQLYQYAFSNTSITAPDGSTFQGPDTALQSQLAPLTQLLVQMQNSGGTSLTFNWDGSSGDVTNFNSMFSTFFNQINVDQAHLGGDPITIPSLDSNTNPSFTISNGIVGDMTTAMNAGISDGGNVSTDENMQFQTNQQYYTNIINAGSSCLQTNSQLINKIWQG